MEFDDFQNDTGNLRRYDLDFSGSPSIAEDIPVELDVQFENRRSYNREGEQIDSTASAYVTPNNALNSKSVSELNKDWRLLYDGEEIQVERIHRVRKPAQNVIDHYRLVLR